MQYEHEERKENDYYKQKQEQWEKNMTLTFMCKNKAHISYKRNLHKTSTTQRKKKKKLDCTQKNT